MATVYAIRLINVLDLTIRSIQTVTVLRMRATPVQIHRTA